MCTYLSIRIFNLIKGDPRKQKAAAIALCLKYVCGRNSIIRNFNPNKISKLIHVSPNTFTKYLPVMLSIGIVHFEGTRNEHLVVSKLHSSHKERNIDIHRFDFKSFDTIFQSLRAFIALLIQKRKDYVRRILQLAYNPYPGDDCKAARRKVKTLVRQGILKVIRWTERGISYKRFATELGCCVRTAQRVIEYAISKRWCRKETHFGYRYMKGVNYLELDNYTFTTRDYGFVVSANTYTLSPGIKRCL